MIPDPIAQFLTQHQNVLWLCTLFLDLGFMVVMYRLFGRRGLMAAVVLSILMANLQGPKLTVILGFQTSMGVIFYSGIFFATDLLSEKYGRREANLAVIIGFAISVIVVTMLSVSLLFQPSPDEETTELASQVHQAFVTILDFTPRFVFGSLLAYLISQSFDVWFFHKIKSWTAGKHLWLRNNLSTMTSQLIDTTLYSLVVWWGVVSLETALALGGVKYAFKVAIAAFDTPFIYWARSWPPNPRGRLAGIRR